MKRQLLPVILILTLAFCSRQRNGIRVPGVVDGDIVSIKALFGGTLEKILIQEGQPVKKAQLLARMNMDKIANSSEEIRITEQEIANGEERTRKKMEWLKADITYLQQQVQHLSRLKQDESIAGDQLDRARLQLLEAQTSLSDLEKALAAFQIQRQKLINKRDNLRLMENDLTFTAPTDGVVIEVFSTEGETILPGTLLAEILDLSSLYVESFVEEKEMAGLKLGQKAVIIPDGSERREYPGQISYFGKKAEFSPKYILSEKERQALLYQVKIKILSGQDILKIGMPVTVVFQN